MLFRRNKIPKEFRTTHEWDCGMVDEDDKRCVLKGTFQEMIDKYFEGYNIPRKLINRKYEDFKESHNRVKRWYKIPFDIRTNPSNRG